MEDTVEFTRSQVWAAFIILPLILLAFVLMSYYAGVNDAAVRTVLAKELSCAKLEARR